MGAPGRPLPEREVGEVWVRGPGVTDGYVNLRDTESFAGGWLRVGDLAYMDQGELFVTGRSDEVVVHLGEKYHPEDIERAVLQVTGLSPRACAAFSRQNRQAGELVVVVEADHRPDLPRRASAAIADAVGIAPSEVVVVPHGTVPTTPNGKLQRSKLRQMHAHGELDQWRT
jgi:fatty-acyl-CoA synthase